MDVGAASDSNEHLELEACEHGFCWCGIRPLRCHTWVADCIDNGSAVCNRSRIPHYRPGFSIHILQDNLVRALGGGRGLRFRSSDLSQHAGRRPGQNG